MITTGSIPGLEQPEELLAQASIEDMVSTPVLFPDEPLCAGQTSERSAHLPSASHSRMVSPTPDTTLNREVSPKRSTLEFIPLPTGGYAILINSAPEEHRDAGFA
jgi:hypothetical protein